MDPSDGKSVGSQSTKPLMHFYCLLLYPNIISITSHSQIRRSPVWLSRQLQVNLCFRERRSASCKPRCNFTPFILFCGIMACDVVYQLHCQCVFGSLFCMHRQTQADRHAACCAISSIAELSRGGTAPEGPLCKHAGPSRRHLGAKRGRQSRWAAQIISV